MAKIVITIETSTKTLDVSIDGVKINNAKSVSAYQYRDSSGKANGIDASVMVYENGPSEDVRKETTYYAMGTVEAEKIVKSSDAVYNKDIPNFVTKSNDICDAIAKYFTDKLGKY